MYVRSKPNQLTAFGQLAHVAACWELIGIPASGLIWQPAASAQVQPTGAKGDGGLICLILYHHKA